MDGMSEIELRALIADLEASLRRIGEEDCLSMNSVVRRAAKALRLEIETLKEQLPQVTESVTDG